VGIKKVCKKTNGKENERYNKQKDGERKTLFENLIDHVLFLVLFESCAREWQITQKLRKRFFIFYLFFLKFDQREREYVLWGSKFAR
jgi:hypothetical protein